MVSLVSISFIGILLCVVVIVQTKPLVEPSNNNSETKSPMNKQQLYELYKTMRLDPRLASVSNEDLVSYIYRNFVLGNGDDIDFTKTKNQKQRGNRHQKMNQAE